jgi:predicted transcriptional regulator
VRNSRLFQEYKRSKEETNHLRLLYKSLISRNRYLEKYFYYYQMNQQAQQAKKKQLLVEKREKDRVNFNAQMAMVRCTLHSCQNVCQSHHQLTFAL